MESLVKLLRIVLGKQLHDCSVGGLVQRVECGRQP